MLSYNIWLEYKTRFYESDVYEKSLGKDYKTFSVIGKLLSI